MANLSPMMQQYLEVKNQHKDYVLFFRLGDFYEMFFDDALNISKELELTLTARDCGMPEKAPMCGIPYHSSEGYIKRLIDKGYKVAICEQIENPADAKGLVKREVVRLVTPGTVFENSLLNEEKNNFIAAVIVGAKAFAICFADISTGDVYLMDQKTSDVAVEIINEISKFAPTELLFNDVMLKYEQIGEFIRNKLRCVCELIEDSDLKNDVCMEIIQKQFPEKDFEELEFNAKPLAVKALGGLLCYVNKTHKNATQRIIKLNIYKENQFMNIDITAKRNLEITQTMRNGEKSGTLLWVLDKTKTAMGKRYMRKALEQPLLSLSDITKRQSAIHELLKSNVISDELSSLLSKVYDLERLMTRVMYGTVNPREVRALSFTLSNLPQLKETTEQFTCSFLVDVSAQINPLEDICSLIENAVSEEPPITFKDGGVIKVGFNDDLDEYRDLCNHAKDYIAGIEQTQKEKTGIKNLKINYNRVFGYYIEVTKSYLDLVPDTYIRKQTLANCERYVTEELKQLEQKVLTASEKILALETEIFDEVRQFIAKKIHEMQETASAIARLDFILSLTKVASENNYVCPLITLDDTISIKDGRHPAVELLLKDSMFVPNDTMLDQKSNQMLIITGPNMAGKSTYMRQVAIISIMAQIGSFVPASSATIGICDKIFTRVGASDDLSAGQSTFMVEMSEVAHIMKNCTPKSLVILDEIGRGTSTFDGMSIAKAVITYMVTNKKLHCKTLFATHYHELTDLETDLDGVKNYNIAVKKRGDDITFLRKIIRGGADDSYGIEVAKLAGVPDEVVELAKQFLLELEGVGTHSKEKIAVQLEQEQSQTSLFEQAGNVVVDKINVLQIDALTPIEALNILYELKKMAAR